MASERLTGKMLQIEATGTPLQVGDLLGGGTQGELYQANVDGREVAIKWFSHLSMATPKDHLEWLIDQEVPDPRFVWPEAIVIDPEAPKYYGYIMELVDTKVFKSITKLMTRAVDPNFRELILACSQLADAFYHLHIAGLCYKDISNNNILVDQKTGDIRIVDNDNVTVNLDERVSILGTPRFMAPEIVRSQQPGAPKVYPSTYTDVFSLAVLLFYMLFIHHPLDGRQEYEIHALDMPAMIKLYGKNPIYIFDSDDKSNRPVEGEQDNPLIYRKIYPKFLLDLFERVFTDGIRDPENGRVEESVWRKELIRLHDAIIYCQKSDCGAENFYDRETLRQSKPITCWNCDSEVPLPPRLKLGANHIVMLTHDTRLYPHHLSRGKSGDISRILASVNEHPTRRGLFGLRNQTEESWFVSTGDSADWQEIAPGRSLNLDKNFNIKFGEVEGAIRS